MTDDLEPRSLGANIRRHRFSILLAVLIVYIIGAPFFVETARGKLVHATFISFVLLAAIGCLDSRRLSFATSRWFGLLTLASGWVTVTSDLPVVSVVSAAFRILFFGVVTAALIGQIAATPRVTPGTIVGAISGYLLLGIIGTAGFLIVEFAEPGSLRTSVEPLTSSAYIYYAFVTLATVGYGDIVPVGPAARSLAILLAIAGQLYIAVLIALIVGKSLSPSDRDSAGT
jgi:hypothetical protein